MVVQWLLLAAGFGLLIKGADFFVDGAVGIAKKFGIPQLIIGLTVVALGTSAPEAAVSIASATKGAADITIGNVVGSNILNVFIILGLTAVIVPIAVSSPTIKFDIPFMLGVTTLMLLLGLDGAIGRIDAAILVGLLAFYIFYLIRMVKSGKIADEEDKPTKKLTIPVALILAGIGITMIIFGSQLTVNAATEIARSFGVSERFIGLTVVALGTSLPELFTSVTAARKGNADIAVGNVVGSNIFNILFVVGISGLITNIPFAVPFRVDTLIAIGSGALLWLLCFRKRKLFRWGGAILLAGYAAYFAFWLV